MAVPLSDSLGLIWPVMIGGAVALVMHVLFHIFRRKNPQIYTFREVFSRREELADSNGRPLYYKPAPPTSFFGWVKPTLEITEDELVKKYGLDQAMLLRLLRAMLEYFSVSALVTAAILYPVYATGPHKNLPEDDELFVAGLGIISMSNVPEESVRFYATTVVDIILVSYMLWILLREFRVFTRYRIYYRRLQIPANYGIVVMDIPKEFRTNEQLFEVFNNAYPGEVETAAIVVDLKNVLKLKKQYEKAMLKLEIAEWASVNKAEKGPPKHRPGVCGCCMCWKEKVDSVDYWRAEMERLKTEIEEIQHEEDKKTTRAGFLLFRTRRAASIAAQTVFGAHYKEWHTACAPDPKAVNWGKIGMHQGLATVMKWNSIVWLCFFLIVWAGVVAAIMAVANLQNLSESISWLGWINDLPPFIVGLLETYLPVVILIVLNMIPFIVMKILAKSERLHSWALVEARIRNYVYILQVFGTYFFVVIGGTVIANISTIQDIISDVNNLEKLPVVLAAAVPANAFFFMALILTQTLIGLSVEFSQVSRVIVTWIFRKFLSKTKRAHLKTDFMDAPYDFLKPYIEISITILITLAYQSIMPVICFFTSVYFGLSYIYTKYTIGFTKANEWDDGGYLFRGALGQIIFALYVKVLTMIGLLGLNKAAGPAALQAIPLVCVMVFHHYVKQMFPPVIKYGSFKEYGQVLDEDEYQRGMAELKTDDPKKLFRMLVDEVPQSYRDLYVQPALQPPEPYESQGGVSFSKTKLRAASGKHDDLEAQNSPPVRVNRQYSDEGPHSFHTADDAPSSKMPAGA